MKLISQGAYAQELFNNKVVNLGQPATDKQVSAAVLKSVNDLIEGATNIPKGADLPANATNNPANTTPATVQQLFTAQKATSTSIVLLGESHTNAADHKRAEDYIAAMNSNPPTLKPGLVVFERALTYNAPKDISIVRESNLTTAKSNGGMVDFGIELSKAQRSMVVAGYLVLYVASGNQQDINRIVMFYGANHNDIYSYFDYFARHTGAYYVVKETRDFYNIKSNV
ncbi:hypothetical protein [Pedobacter nototheniae]|uniref:hypothetical protein n=1 Tax=Pedobacter nototheniae TaxID=2488994 RepID=UPI00292E555F|nr:hypothetical protein [Pedobacter nototheniae]